MRNRPLLFGLISLMASGAASGVASAQDRRRDVALTMGGGGYYDAAYIGAGATLFAIGTLAMSSRHAGVAPLDGRGGHEQIAWADHASDWSVGAGALGGVALGLGTEIASGQQGRDRWRAPLIFSEAALMTSGIIHFSKNFAGVCRPRAYRASGECSGEGEPRSTDASRLDEAHRAFPSGHSGPVAAMAGAAWGMWLLPSGKRPEFLPAAFILSLHSIVIAGLRVHAGAHSLVDTSTAVVLGAAVGFVTALLHTRAVDPTAATSAQPGPAPLTLGGAF